MTQKSTWFKDKKEEMQTKEQSSRSKAAKITAPLVGGNEKKDKSSWSTAAKITPQGDNQLYQDNPGGRKRRRDEELAMKRKGGNLEEGQDKKKQRTIGTTTVFFVDSTKGGILAKRLRAEEDRLAGLTGFRVKIVESGGSQLRQVLPNTNPWAGMKCGRSKCWTCAQNDETAINCFKRNVLYESQCMWCNPPETTGEEAGKEKRKSKDKNKKKLEEKAVYVGETSRSLFERTSEHFKDAMKRKPDSHIRKHWDEAHPGKEMPPFTFKIVQSFQDCLTRQVSEAVRIGLRGEVLNSKSEFSRCSIARLVVEKPEWEKKEEERLNNIKEKEKRDKKVSSHEEEISTRQADLSTQLEHVSTQEEESANMLEEEMKMMEEIQEEFEEIMRLEMGKQDEVKKKSPWWKEELRKDNPRPAKRLKKRDKRKNQEEEGLGRITDWFKVKEVAAEKTTLEEERKEESSQEEYWEKWLEPAMWSEIERRMEKLEEKKKKEGIKRMERKEKAVMKRSRWMEEYMNMDWLETSQVESQEVEDNKTMEWLEEEPGQETPTSSEDRLDMETDIPEGWKGDEERLVTGKWDRGKRKRYEKGRWGRLAKERKKAGATERWSPRRMERRKKLRGRRRLEQANKEEHKWLEDLVYTLVERTGKEGWKLEKDRRKRKERLEKAARRKDNWEEVYFMMDWLECGVEVERKRRERRDRAAKKKIDWLEDHCMEWLEIIPEEDKFMKTVSTPMDVSSQVEELDMHGYNELEDYKDQEHFIFMETVSTPEEVSSPMEVNYMHGYTVSIPTISISSSTVSKEVRKATSQPHGDRCGPFEEAGAPGMGCVKKKVELFEKKAEGHIKRKIVKGKRRKNSDSLIQLTISRYFSNFNNDPGMAKNTNLAHTEGPVVGHTDMVGRKPTLPGTKTLESEHLMVSGEKKRKLSGGTVRAKPPKMNKSNEKSSLEEGCL